MAHRRPRPLRPGGGEPHLKSPTVAAPLAEVVRGLFRPSRSGHPPRLGLEAEVIPVGCDDARPVPPLASGSERATVPVLRSLSRTRGWREEETATGVPRFVLDDGAVLTFEPGGQIEYASRTHTSLEAADARVREVLELVAGGMDREGIRLLARGMDPRTPVADARLVLSGDRYPRQRAHYDRIGPHGRRMMLQSAALHLNLDLGPESAESWAAANTLAPLLIALFANAPTRAGSSSPHRSHRAAVWRRLDPSRTGAFGPSIDPPADYLAFALDAVSFLLGDPGAPGLPFREWLAQGATAADFGHHLTTLFPEVRPRGYLEIRSVDALPARWCIVPAAVAFSLLHHREVRQELIRTVPPTDPERLERAGRAGLRDPGLRAEADRVVPLVLRGLEDLGPSVAGPGVFRRVQDFFDRFTLRGLDPGDATGDTVTD